MSTQKKESSVEKEVTYADDSVISENESNIDEIISGKKSEDKFVAGELPDTTVEDSVAPSKRTSKFRDQLSDEDLAAVRAAAPEIAGKMLKNFNYIIDFGGEVLEGVSNVTSKLLKEQSGIDLPEADEIATNILRALDGYEEKYAKKENKFFQNLMNKIRGIQYSLKNAINDAKSLEEKMDIASRELQKMIEGLKDNVIRGEELRKAMKNSIGDIIRVLAIFEEVIDLVKADLVEMENLKKGKKDEDLIIWKGNKLTALEFEEEHAHYAKVFSELEKTWFSWRQRLFVYNTNIVAIRNIIDTSVSSQHTLRRIKNETIDMAKNQLVQWQQAEKLRISAKSAQKVNDISNKIISRASEGAAEAVEEAAKAANLNMLNEDTILAMTNSVRRQFDAIVTSEREGRALRARNLAIIQQSEQTIKEVSEEAQKKLLEDAMAIVRADSEAVEAQKGENVLSNIGFGESRIK